MLPDQIRLTRSFWLLVHAEMRGLARIRTVSNFLADQIHRERAMFVLPEQGTAGDAV